jgi:hypothetical protein
VAEHLVVAERRGCDLHPIDLRSDEDRLRLESYVWAEQPERLARLRAAVMLAEKIAPRVDARSAPDWLGERLAERSPGLVDVVFHSAFWPYLDEAAQHQVREAMARAGERASERAPLAWLRYEGLSKEMTLALDLWPGGESWTLAHGENRGRFVRWGAS